MLDYRYVLVLLKEFEYGNPGVPEKDKNRLNVGMTKIQILMLTQREDKSRNFLLQW